MRIVWVFKGPKLYLCNQPTIKVAEAINDLICLDVEKALFAFQESQGYDTGTEVIHQFWVHRTVTALSDKTSNQCTLKL